MFNKLKSFSEDVAKSFNEIQQGDPIRRNAETIKQLKNGSAILNTKTPDLGDLKQPEDTSTVPGEPGSDEKGPDGVNLANSESSETQLAIATSGPLKDIDMDQLPQLVRAKLKKFAKYEDKYPVLLDAYKTEKKKGELVAAFEKVLRECTPVSSIADAGLLLDFLKGLSDKSQLLEVELRKAVAETNKLTGEKAELMKKLTDSEKTVKYAEEKVGKLVKLEEDLQLETQVLKKQILALENDIGNSKQQVGDLEERLRQAEAAASDASAAVSAGPAETAETERNPEGLGDKVESAIDPEQGNDNKEEVELSKKDLEVTNSLLESTKSDLERTKSDLESTTSELDITKNALENTSSELKSVKSELKTAKENLEMKEQLFKDLQQKLDGSKNLDQEIIALKTELEKAQSVKDQAEAANSKIQTELETTRSELKGLQNLQLEVKQLKMAARDAVPSADHDLLKEKLQTLETESKTKSAQIERIAGEKNALEAMVEKQNIEISELKNEIGRMERSLLEREKQLERLHTEKISAQDEVSASEKDTQTKDVVQKVVDTEGSLKDNIKADIQDKSIPSLASDEWKSKYEVASELLEALTKERDVLSKDLSDCKKKLTSKEEEIEHLRDLLRDLGDDLVTAKDDLKSIKERASAEVAEKVATLEQKELKLVGQLKQKEDELVSVQSLLKQAEEELKLANENLTSATERAKQNEEEAKKNADEANKFADEAKKNSDEASKYRDVVKKNTDLTSQLKFAQEELISTKDSLQTSQKDAATFKASVAEIKAQSAKLEGELKTSAKEIASLKAEKQKLNERVHELTKFKSVDSSLKLEIASLQSSISHKDEQIRELKDSIEKKNKERDELNNTISSLKTSNGDLMNANRGLIAEKSELINKQEITFERTNSLNAELSKLQVSRQKVATELDALKLKYEALTKTRASSSDEIQSLRQLYEELNMKARDSQLKIDNLEDDLSESKNLLQERTRESSTLRRLLMDAEEQTNIKTSELRNEIRTINEEKQELESNFLASMKKRQREIDELKAVGDGYLVKVRDLERKCEDLKKQYEPFANSSPAPSAEFQEREKSLENTIEELRTSLQASSKKVQDYENLNRILKKLNEELTLKFERLSKNYKHITQQYRQMQSQNSATPKSATPSARNSVEEKRPDEMNVAYLKNVLLGFVEHKEQRGQLLPVVKTLFHFDDDEERKLVNALK